MPDISEKQKREVLSRLKELNKYPDKAVGWKEAQRRISAFVERRGICKKP